jgi:hypothetical protein
MSDSTETTTALSETTNGQGSPEEAIARADAAALAASEAAKAKAATHAAAKEKAAPEAPKPEGTPADQTTTEQTEAEKAAALEAEKADWHKQYVKVDNEHAQAAIDMLEKSGVSPLEANAIFEEAIKDRDLSKVKWNILEDKLGKPAVTLMKAGIQQYAADLQNSHFATEKMVYETIGGQENWPVMREYFQKQEKSATDVGKAVPEFRRMLDQGGQAAKLAIAEMKRIYEADAQNKGLGVNKIDAGKGTAVARDTSALSREAYQAELQKAQKINNWDQREEVIQALRVRRMAGMKAGLN